ncbi:MAG: hypothetical protein EOP87_13715 [Verrucomicrobiaceae bacterium]|nr:MAG: hypothetical protein EOP87_13715 [Verrucomicrobiaceae bacterium]
MNPLALPQHLLQSSRQSMHRSPATPAAHPLLAGRRRFWLRSILISAAAGLLVWLTGLLGVMSCLHRVFQANGELPREEAAREIARAHAAMDLIGVATVAVSSLAALWLIFSLIRYFTLPKKA